MPRDSMFNAVAATRADITCSQTINVYAFHEQEYIKLI